MRRLLAMALLLPACNAVLPLSPAPSQERERDAVADLLAPTDVVADRPSQVQDAPADARWLDDQVVDAADPPGDASSPDVHHQDVDLELLCASSTSWGCITATNQCQLRCPPPLGASPQLLIQCTTSGKCDCTAGGLTTLCSGTFPFVKVAPCSACDAARATGCCAP